MSPSKQMKQCRSPASRSPGEKASGNSSSRSCSPATAAAPCTAGGEYCRNSTATAGGSARPSLHHSELLPRLASRLDAALRPVAEAAALMARQSSSRGGCAPEELKPPPPPPNKKWHSSRPSVPLLRVSQRPAAAKGSNCKSVPSSSRSGLFVASSGRAGMAAAAAVGPGAPERRPGPPPLAHQRLQKALEGGRAPCVDTGRKRAMGYWGDA